MAKSKETRPAGPRSIGAVMETPPRVDLGLYFLKHTILPPQDSDWLLVRPEGQSVLTREDLIRSADPVPSHEEPVAEGNLAPMDDGNSPTPFAKGGQEGFSERTREEDALLSAPVAEVTPVPAPEPSPEPPPAESRPGETTGLSQDSPSPPSGGEGRGEGGAQPAQFVSPHPGPLPEEEGSHDFAKQSGTPAASAAAPSLDASPAHAAAPEGASAGTREALMRGDTQEMVVFSMGGQLFGTEILKVKEIIRMPEPTPTPQAPPFVRGIVNLRGAVVPVVELRDLLGMPGTGSSNKPYLMIANAAGLTMGVIVDGISRVIKISGESLEEYQGGVLGSGSGVEAVWGVVKEKDSLVSLIDLDAVFRDSRFHALMSRG